MPVQQTEQQVLSTCIKACNKWLLRMQLAEQEGRVSDVEYAASMLSQWSRTAEVKARALSLQEVEADGVK